MPELQPEGATLLGKDVPATTNGTIEEVVKPMSIYDLYSRRQSTTMLILAALVCLQMPFADTIYFPSLFIIAKDFGTSNGVVALTIALFMIMVGIASLIWGPAADRFGRKWILIIASVAYIVFNIVCYFSPNVVTLIVFRALQGGAASAFITVSSVIIADVFPLNNRGTALGIFNVPMFIGPIVGPVIGGVIGESMGWRFTFIVLIILSAVIILGIVFALPESHQWYVLQRLKKSKQTQNLAIIEAPEIERNPPVFMLPWSALLLAFKPNTSPYLAVSCIEFGAFYGSLTLFSPVMALPPYSYNQTVIGLLYIPMGVGAMFASILGGRITDWSGVHYSTVPEGRMYLSLILSTITFPVGILVYGWCLEYHVHIAPILVSMFIMGFGCMVYFPSVMAYVGGINQEEAGAASAAMFCVVLVSAGICSEVVVYIVEAINFGPMSVLFVAIWIIPTIVCWFLIQRKISKSKKLQSTQAGSSAAA